MTVKRLHAASQLRKFRCVLFCWPIISTISLIRIIYANIAHRSLIGLPSRAEQVNIHLFVVTVPLIVDEEFVLVRADWQVYNGEEVMSAKIHTTTPTGHLTVFYFCTKLDIPSYWSKIATVFSSRRG